MLLPPVHSIGSGWCERWRPERRQHAPIFKSAVAASERWHSAGTACLDAARRRLNVLVEGDVVLDGACGT